MKAIISTTIQTSAENMWGELQNVSSLIHVAAPLLIFKSHDGKPLPDQWYINHEYPLSVSLFGILPLGKHIIRVLNVDSQKLQIFSNESGSLAKTWNHLIKIETIDDNRIRYSDEIEIKAGILTPGIWLFALVFYRHRQRRWKLLLKKQQRYN